MPKKNRKTNLNIKPQSSAPPAFRYPAPGRLGNSAERQQDEPPSVNELIHRHRHERSVEKLAISNTSHLQTPGALHPAVRDILDLPITPPPTPRNGLYHGPSRTRRIPGPPPPQSWLSHSIHSPKVTQNVTECFYSSRRIQRLRCVLPGLSLPPLTSLRHLVLKSMAASWLLRSEYEDAEIADLLPTAIKETLLSYIGLYADASPLNALADLFPLQEDILGEAPNDCHDVKCLDLTNAITKSTSMKHVRRRLIALKPAVRLGLAEPVENDTEDSVPASWDAVSDSDEAQDTQYNYVPQPYVPKVSLRFPNLRHLSLALRPENGDLAKWPDLLSAASLLSTLQSLSLAFWPRPTYTPRAARTRVTIRNPLSSAIPATVYGGSNVYSSFDGDWKEAAGILKSLSRSLYCLRWLDLTGCGDWITALVWKQLGRSEGEHGQSNRSESPYATSSDFQSTYREDGASVNGPTQAPGPEWNGSWRGIEYMCLDVGWIPAAMESEGQSSAIYGGSNASVHSDLVEAEHPVTRGNRDERLHPGRFGSPGHSSAPSGTPWNTDEERRKYYDRKEVERYTETRRQSHLVAQQLRELRRRAGGRWIKFDLDDESEQ